MGLSRQNIMKIQIFKMKSSCIALMALAGLLSGCGWINRQADAAGEYMPVVGERCENWQCFTEEGQQKSEMNKRMKAMQQNGQVPQAVPQAVPQNPQAPAQAPERPMPDAWYQGEEEKAQ